MGTLSLVSKRPAVTGLLDFSAPLPELPSRRYPNHDSATMTTRPSNTNIGSPRASPWTLAAPPASSLARSSHSAPFSSTNINDTHSTSTANSSVLTPSGAVSDGPSSSAGHSSGSQSCQPGGPSLYYSGHMTGSWPTPGASQHSGYSYANANSQSPGSGPLAQPTYMRNNQPYGAVSSPPLQHFSGRGSSSAPGTEGLPAPQPYQDHSAFQSPVTARGTGAGGGGPGGGGTLGSPLGSQSHGVPQQPGLAQPMLATSTTSATRPAMSGQGPATAQEGSSYRPPPTPTSCYPPSSTSQQSSYSTFPSPVTQQPSSTTASPATSSGPPGPRGLASISAMAPPMPYSGGRGHPIQPMASYASYGQIPGPVLSNMHHPGAPLSMVGGMPGLPGYGHHPGLSPHHPHQLYVHASAPPQQPDNRPFKCDECVQAFNRNHDLKRHKKIHMAIKPFGCSNCEKRFSRKDALKRHRLVKGCGSRSPGDGPEATSGDQGSSRGDTAGQNKEGSPRLTKKDAK